MSAIDRDVYALTAQYREQTPATGPAIVAHVGSQTLRLPAEELTRRASGMLAALDAWKAQASGTELAVYGAFKAALNLGLPFVGSIIAATGGLLPALPARPRHSDPIVYLLAYLFAALPVALARGAWTVTVDGAGNVTALDWTEDGVTKEIH